MQAGGAVLRGRVQGGGRLFHRKKIVWLLMLPGMLGILIFYVVPFFGGVYYSVTDGSFANNYVGFDNYLRVWQNPMFQLGLKNTLELSVLCAPTIWLLSFLMAAMLKSLKERSTGFRNILLMPYLMPSSALLLIWLTMFDYGGVVNRLVVGMGMERVLWLEGNALRVPWYCFTYGKTLAFRWCFSLRRWRPCTRVCTSLPPWRAPAV